jgi:HEAT repeat protein
VVELLLPGLADKDEDVRVNTVRALVKTGDHMAVHSVIDVATNLSENWLARKNAIISLARSGRPEAIKAIEDMMNCETETPLVKETISVILSEIEITKR